MGCNGLYWAVLGCSGRYWAVLGFGGRYWAVAGVGLMSLHPIHEAYMPVNMRSKFFLRTDGLTDRGIPWGPRRPKKGGKRDEGDEEVDQGEVSTIILEMFESSGFRKYSTLLVIQLISRHLRHCPCICLCICVPYSFLNSYYHKLSENVWVLGCGATRSEIWTGVTIAGQPNERTNKER